MRVTEIQTFVIKAESGANQPYWGKQMWGSDANSSGAIYPPPFRLRSSYSDTINTVIVKLSTDTGLVGYGEAKAPVAPEATKAIIDNLLSDVIYGQDPTDIHVLWDKMFATMHLRGHSQGFLMEAISGIDIALWDLVGKALDIPIYKLLGGGIRSRVNVYASGVPAIRADAGEQAEDACRGAVRRLVDQGFKAIKIGIGPSVNDALATIRLVRSVVGNGFPLFVDAACCYNAQTAIRLGRELEQLGIQWLEAPIPLEYIDGYETLAHSLDLPIALDLFTNRFQVRDFLVRNAIDVVQPDVCRSGGISESKRIADLADVFGIPCAPHVSIGSAIHLAATLQLAASLPNLWIMEYGMWFTEQGIGENPLGNPIIEEPLEIKDGYLEVPNKPGLGITIDEEALLEYKIS